MCIDCRNNRDETVEMDGGNKPNKMDCEDQDRTTSSTRAGAGNIDEESRVDYDMQTERHQNMLQ